MQLGKINVLIGNSFGSEGKGNIAAYLAERYGDIMEICVSNNSMNAGHCFLDENGEKQVLKILPVSGVVAKDSVIILGSGAAFTLDRFFEEVNKFKVNGRVFISPTAVIIDDACIKYEQEKLRYVSSTMQGVGAAFGMKAMRSQDIKLAKDIRELERFICPEIPEYIINCVNSGGTVFAEIPQGIGLSIDSEFYPYCTSRPINVAQAFSYMDVPVSLIGDVYGVSRSYIIRVGGVDDFTSGNVYDDSVEITWDELSKKLGRNVKELTTVTKRVRRVFTFSKYGFERGVKRNGINICFLTFADYLNEDEKKEMEEYLSNPEFRFKEIYMCSGFGNFKEYIHQIR